jgi:hypothetical protein
VALCEDAGGLFVVGGVFFGEGFEVFGEIVNRVNGVVIAGWDAGATVGALIGIDEELRHFGELGFVLARVDAIDGASFDAVLVLGARVRDYESHLEKPSPGGGGQSQGHTIGEGMLLNLQGLENGGREIGLIWSVWDHTGMCGMT